jgi:hypothetical protein
MRSSCPRELGGHPRLYLPGSPPSKSPLQNHSSLWRKGRLESFAGAGAQTTIQPGQGIVAEKNPFFTYRAALLRKRHPVEHAPQAAGMRLPGKAAFESPASVAGMIYRRSCGFNAGLPAIGIRWFEAQFLPRYSARPSPSTCARRSGRRPEAPGCYSRWEWSRPDARSC